MPYKNIVFIKLFVDLFEEDDRFLYQLNERQQLLYIKMLYLAGKTNNVIPKNVDFILNKTNYQSSDYTLTKDLEHIMEVFKQFTQTKAYYTFKNFNELHNRVTDYKNGSSVGRPKDDLGTSESTSQKKKKNKKKNSVVNVPLKQLKEIIEDLNTRCHTSYKHTTNKTKKLINARMNEGFTVDDFKAVHRKKANEWLDTKWEKYLRPQTLYGTKFESYLNQKEKLEVKYE